MTIKDEMAQIRRHMEKAVEDLRTKLATIRTGSATTLRTETDIPLPVVIGGVVALGLTMWLIPALELGLAQTLLAISLSFFFVVVSARIVWIVGSTSRMNEAARSRPRTPGIICESLRRPDAGAR